MFIDVKELARRKEESNNLIERMSVAPSEPIDVPLDTSKFKKDGTNRKTPEYSPEQRALIGVSAIALGPKKAAEVLDVSESYAKVLARGSYSTALDPEERDRRNQELKDAVYEGLASIREKAREKLMMALDGIDEVSLGAIKGSDKAKVLANISNQLSSVIDRTINKGEHLHDSRSTHLHLYAPETRPITAFTIKRIGGNTDSEATGSSNAQSSSE
jgi:hypothetical protein